MWQVAHQVIGYAEENKKAIAIERLKDIKGYRGDGKAKLRKRFQQWAYKSLLDKIKRLGEEGHTGYRGQSSIHEHNRSLEVLSQLSDRQRYSRSLCDRKKGVKVLKRIFQRTTENY